MTDVHITDSRVAQGIDLYDLVFDYARGLTIPSASSACSSFGFFM